MHAIKLIPTKWKREIWYTAQDLDDIMEQNVKKVQNALLKQEQQQNDDDDITPPKKSICPRGLEGIMHGAKLHCLAQFALNLVLDEQSRQKAQPSTHPEEKISEIYRVMGGSTSSQYEALKRGIKDEKLMRNLDRTKKKQKSTQKMTTTTKTKEKKIKKNKKIVKVKKQPITITTTIKKKKKETKKAKIIDPLKKKRKKKTKILVE